MQDLPCFCINLDDRPEKWEATQRAFEGTGVSPQRFSAIRHAEGWRGCGASHVAIAREAMRLGLPSVLIIEDDCLPVGDFAERWSIVKRALTDESGSWDIFLGGPTYVQGPAEPLGRHLIQIDTGFALHFYVLHATAYEKAIAWNPDRHGPIDVYYSNQFRIVTTYPLLAIQRPSDSDIKKKSTNYIELFQSADNTLQQLQYSFRTRDGTLLLLFASALFLGLLWS